MSRWVQISSIIVITAIGSFIYVALTSTPTHYIQWLNSIFIIALLYIVCSAGTVFVYSPPFQRLAYNFSYFFSKLKRSREMADKMERKDRSYKGDKIEEKERPQWTSSILVSGIILAFFSMILSFISST